MQKANITKEKVWVCFMPHAMDDRATLFQKLFRWFLNHFKKNFSHVVICKRAEISGNIIFFNCCSDNFDVKEISKIDFFNFITKKEVTTVVSEVKTGPIKAKGLITCVSTAKHFLGIDKPFIITPYQLYKYLEKQNGK